MTTGPEDGADTIEIAGVDYSPLDYAIQDDPYPVYARLRSEAPVFYNPDVDFYALSRHADVAPALRDHLRYSNENGPLMEREFWTPEASKMHSFVAMDPPEHGRWRRLISESFSPRSVRELEPEVDRIAQEVVTAAVERGQFDLMRDVASVIPLAAMSIMLGVPESERDYMQSVLNRTVHRDEDATAIGPDQMAAFGELTEYYQSLVSAKRESPQKDLITGLTEGELDGRPLSDFEIIGMLHLLGGASTVTTIDLLGNAWYWAWKFPDQMQKALNEGQINGWVEESLRYDSPVQMVIRKVREAFTLHGVDIPEGAQILFLMGSANRDHDVFPDADAYNIERDAGQLLSFSGGPHLCVGNLLARKIARSALNALATRVTDYDIDEGAAQRVHRSTVRGFTHLPTYVTLR